LFLYSLISQPRSVRLLQRRVGLPSCPYSAITDTTYSIYAAAPETFTRDGLSLKIAGSAIAGSLGAYALSIYQKRTSHINPPVSSWLANPTDLVKTRMQRAGPRPAHTVAAFTTVYGEGGLQSLWRGAGATTIRAGFELFTNYLLRSDEANSSCSGDNARRHWTAFGGGFVLPRLPRTPKMTVTLLWCRPDCVQQRHACGLLSRRKWNTYNRVFVLGVTARVAALPRRVRAELRRRSFARQLRSVQQKTRTACARRGCDTRLAGWHSCLVPPHQLLALQLQRPRTMVWPSRQVGYFASAAYPGR
jgi:hypothetical protein